jgi:hypothetical protein
MTLQVIGAGFGRTGTATLRDVLETLGFGPCHHMRDLIIDPTKADPWARLTRGEDVDWDEVFAGYNSACDWPSSDYYRQLAAHFPDAKVILTIRDPESWFRSCSQTIFSDLNLIIHKDQSDLGRAMRAILARNFAGRADDHDTCIAAFKERTDEVIRTVPPDRLLVYQVSEGWEPLCRFLGKPVPDAAFPVSNTTESWRTTAAKRLQALAKET